jgi:phage terminase small subunit
MRLRAELSTQLKIDRDRIVAEVAALAFSDISEFLDYDNDTLTLKDMASLTRSQTRQIKAVTIDSSGRVRIEMHDKSSAQKLLAAMLGLNNPDVNLTLNQFVLHAPMPAASSEAWEAEAQRFLEGPVVEATALPEPQESPAQRAKPDPQAAAGPAPWSGPGKPLKLTGRR